ncbi:hypothetical protein OH76DRAFT_1351600 [Lentinus brumalis]|uniref:BTB domain-containing protein n=1 Tax=Lentinus brumalis TaxID=2498619 RepID=A0A371D8Y9_9APHY|nr:hypothetical protein OH76DRAFT_1351600 [Polyporus brumalis]
MSEHIRKRARRDSDPEPSSRDPPREMGTDREAVDRERDQELWYEDGNISLVAGNTEFRVFKGILADHSPVFKDMFSLPQPPNPTPTQPSEACPVVYLTDYPEEVRHLLRVCIPKTGASRYVPHDPTYDEIASLIRLGHKYQMPHLVDDSISYLKRYFTDDFDTYAKLDSLCPPRFTTCHAVGVVNLARLTGCMQLLPSALLMCCLIGDKVFKGAFRRRGEQREQLHPDDLKLCYVARTELAAAAVAMMLRIFRPQYADRCKQPPTCQSALINLVSQQHEHANQICTTNPFMPRLTLYEHLRGVLCRRCFAMLEERDTSERRTMWKKLPELLGIVVDGWAADDNAGEAAPQAATA